MASLLLTLAGLFGMHGLGMHGTETHSGHTAASTSTPSAAADTARDTDAILSHVSHVAGETARLSVEAVSSAVAATASVAPSTPAGNDGAGGMLMGAAGMCLAVLLLSMLALAVYLGASRPRPVAVRTSRSTGVPVASGRDPDPPSLIVLSIQRC